MADVWLWLGGLATAGAISTVGGAAVSALGFASDRVMFQCRDKSRGGGGGNATNIAAKNSSSSTSTAADPSSKSAQEEGKDSPPSSHPAFQMSPPPAVAAAPPALSCASLLCDGVYFASVCSFFYCSVHLTALLFPPTHRFYALGRATVSAAVSGLVFRSGAGAVLGGLIIWGVEAENPRVDFWIAIYKSIVESVGFLMGGDIWDLITSVGQPQLQQQQQQPSQLQQPSPPPPPLAAEQPQK